jgi:Protein of unknown function (DUF2752)
VESIKSSTTERVLACATFLAGIGGAIIVRQNNPVTAGFFPQCPLYAITGLHCPGCGMTRGLHAFLHGDILPALHFNALLPIFLFVGGYIAVSLCLVAVRGKGLSFKIFSPFAMWSFLILGILFSVLRNIPAYPFSSLAP